MNCGSKYKVTPPESFYAVYEYSINPAKKRLCHQAGAAKQVRFI
jgi:hypothetical protein